MLFKVYSFAVDARKTNLPIQKHGIDDDEYKGAWSTDFEYKYTAKKTNNRNKKSTVNKRISMMGGGSVAY